MSHSLEAKIDAELQLQDLNMRETRSVGDDVNLTENLHEERKPRYKNIIHLWEFLLELLADESCKSMITWSREAYGEFKLKNHEEVAKRWGKLKRRPSMNYEKLSRALRHYYKQGIIRKVPGQRLVYKFHKLPYEYTPGKNRVGSKVPITSPTSATRQGGHFDFNESSLCGNRGRADDSDRPLERMRRLLQDRTTVISNPSHLPTSPTRTIREDGEFCFKGSSTCASRRTTDDSERTLTNKERMRRLLQERATMTRNLDKPSDPEQNEERRQVLSPHNSLEFPSVSSLLPYGRPMLSTPMHPAVCFCGCSLQDVKLLCQYPTQIMYPAGSTYENFRSLAGWNYINSLPVSVMTSRY